MRFYKCKLNPAMFRVHVLCSFRCLRCCGADIFPDSKNSNTKISCSPTAVRFAYKNPRILCVTIIIRRLLSLVKFSALGLLSLCVDMFSLSSRDKASKAWKEAESVSSVSHLSGPSSTVYYTASSENHLHVVLATNLGFPELRAKRSHLWIVAILAGLDVTWVY